MEKILVWLRCLIGSGRFLKVTSEIGRGLKSLSYLSILP